jgi:predicted nucleic acid-binding protein
VLSARDRLPDEELHVPALCDLEFASTLRRLLRRQHLTQTTAAEAISFYLDLPLVRHDHVALLGRILDLRDNFTAYDASYVALAELLRLPLLTRDRRLARAVRRHQPHVVLA